MIGRLHVSPDEASATIRVLRGCPPFAIIPQLIRAVGSSSFRVDRGEPGGLRHVRWVRSGRFLALVEMNTHYVDAPRTSAAAADSFARAVLYRAPILEEDGDGALVEVTGLALLDIVDVRSRSMSPDWSAVSVDPSRSWLLADETFQHPNGIELTADLTINGARGAAAERVVPDLRFVTVTQRLTLMSLSDQPIPARRYRPASGGYGKRFTDFSLPVENTQDSGWQPRFRLERTAPVSPSPVRRPIVFTLDPEVPEPWRSAIIEGGNWWKDAFEQAGFLDAFRVEAGRPGEDLAKAGSNPIWWVHRDARGFSMGAALTDPRSGEILKGNVRLGSQRIRQLTQLGEALLSPYGRDDEESRLEAIRRMVYARARQLAAHEIGHALGFMHNYSSHLHPHPSVMDYPHPVLRLDDAGEVTLDDAYAAGLGPWDVLAVRASYEQFPPGEEETGLDRLLEEAAGAGLGYLTDEDGHAPSASSTRGVPWVFGTDPIEALRTIMSVRAKAISGFSGGAVPPTAQTGELETRYVLIHLLHRYHILAVARLLGGADYAYGNASDPATSPIPAPAGQQHSALRELAGLLTPQTVMVPERVRPLIAPPSIRYTRGNADIAGHLGPLFDPVEVASVASAMVCRLLFEPARLNRIWLQSADDPAVPSIAEVVRQAFAGPLAPQAGDAVEEAVAETTRAELFRSIIQALRCGRLHAGCRRQLEAAAAGIAAQLGKEERGLSTALLADPARPVPWPEPAIPVGIPI